MKNLSNWRAVRVWEGELERELRQRHTLWLHGLWMGALVLGVMWAASHFQMRIGGESLALRYLVTLGVGYLAYLGIVRWCAGALLRRERPADAADLVPDAANLAVDLAQGVGGHVPDAMAAPSPPLQAGGGGDFGGGGASADFSMETDAAQGLGDVAGGALELAAGADEGAVIVVPVVAIFIIGAATLFGAGSLLLLYFGWDVLLAVAVELAFSYASAHVAVRVVREGWVSAAVRLTWKPLGGALICAVALGATIDHFIPAANSLPQAMKIVRAQLR